MYAKFGGATVKAQKETHLDNFYIMVSNYGWAKKNVNWSRSDKGFPNGLNYQKVWKTQVKNYSIWLVKWSYIWCELSGISKNLGRGLRNQDSMWWSFLSWTKQSATAIF